MKKKNKVASITVSAIAFILIIAITAVFGILIETENIKTDISSFLVMLVIMLLGFGAYITGYSLVVKGGYEFVIGSVLLTIGVIVLLAILNVYWVIIVIVGVALLLIAFIGLFLLKAKMLHVERADEKEDFIPYAEKLKMQKEEEKANEGEMPTLKSFKNTDKE